jgi:preprotein translocase subunit SecE
VQVKTDNNMINRIRQYIKDSYIELVQKVSWPTWSELQSSAIIVMVASVIIAVVVLAMDLSFKNIISLIYNLF